MLIILQVGFRENYNNLWRISITICLQLSYKKIIEEILRRIINNEEMKLNEFKKRIISTGYSSNMTIWVVNKKLRNSSDFEAAKRENWNHQIFINNSSFFWIHDLWAHTISFEVALWRGIKEMSGFDFWNIV